MITRRVSEDELRRRFNEERYYERMKNGEFREEIVSQWPRRGGDRRVRNTMSQIVDYRDRFGNRVARVHQYRKRDGSLGGSGRPDPKSIYYDGTLYVLEAAEQWDLPAFGDER